MHHVPAQGSWDLTPWVTQLGAHASVAAAGTGAALGLTLIVAIGAQNAFVLRQGLRREHVGPIVAFCAFADALLMATGVAGLALFLAERPLWAQLMTAAGALYLTGYGLRALWRSAHPQAGLSASPSQPLSLSSALAQTAAFTLLNPHVYLDTVVLVGTVGAQQGDQRGWFVLGASLASLLWFTGLGFGARWLAPVFARPRAWQWLDAIIGVVMLVLAALLVQRIL